MLLSHPQEFVSRGQRDRGLVQVLGLRGLSVRAVVMERTTSIAAVTKGGKRSVGMA